MQTLYIDRIYTSLHGLAWAILCKCVYDVACCSQGDDEQDSMKLIQVQEKMMQFREDTNMTFMSLLSL